MRVGIDFHVVNGIYQGSRSHILEIFYRVAILCPEITFYLMVNDINLFKKNHKNYNLKNINYIELNNSGSLKRLIFDFFWIGIRYKIDLFHFQYITPLFNLSDNFVTIHDVLMESHPQYFNFWFRVRSKIFYRLSAIRSIKVFTVSEFSRNEIIKYYGLSPSKVVKIYNGVNLIEIKNLDYGDMLSKRNLISKNYLLTVGRLEPRKNHITLIRAYEKIGLSAPVLVIVGQRDFGFEILIETINKSFMRHKIHILENIDDYELTVLYKNCLAFVYPSFAEGFGMPPIEAMANGAPVIVANNTALTEIVGDAGLTFTENNSEELKNLIIKIVSDENFRKKLIIAGYNRAKKFDWNLSAEKLAEEYKNYFSQTRCGR